MLTLSYVDAFFTLFMSLIAVYVAGSFNAWMHEMKGTRRDSLWHALNRPRTGTAAAYASTDTAENGLGRSMHDDAWPLSGLGLDGQPDSFGGRADNQIPLVNPASGLPMLGGAGGLDAAGNPYGVCSHDEVFEHDSAPPALDEWPGSDPWNDR